MAPNVPAMLEAHYGVAMAGAVLNALNYRLDARTIAFILGHAETKILITDREFSATIKEALRLCERKPLVIDIDDPLYAGGELLGEMDYERFIAAGDPKPPGTCPGMNGMRSRSITPPAPPAIPRAWSITTAALI